MTNKHKIDSLLITILVVLVIVGLEMTGFGGLGTKLVIPMGFVYFFLSLSEGRSVFKWSSHRGIKWYFAFFLFGCFSILYAVNTQAAIDTQMKMFVVFLYALIVFAYTGRSINAVYHVYVANVLTLFLLLGYVLTLGIQMEGAGRIEGGTLNANAYGYYLFNGLSSLFLLYSISVKRKFLILILIIAGSILSIWVVLASASRGAFVIMSILIIGNLYIITTVSKKTRLKKIFTSFIVVVIMFVGVQYVYFTYINNSFLIERFLELEGKQSTRQYHLLKAIEIGQENPLTGIGAGNYAKVPKAIEPRSFTHNSFAEVFANLGILGLTLYFGFLMSIFIRLKKNFRTTDLKTKKIVYQILLLLILFAVYNWLYVTYLSTLFMQFIFVIYAHLIWLERRLDLNKNEDKYLSS